MLREVLEQRIKQSPFLLALLDHHKAEKTDWRIQPLEVIEHLAAQGSVTPYMKKETKFKDGVQTSWSVLSVFVQTVHYRATSIELFCIISL